MKLNKARVILFTIITFSLLLFTGCDNRKGDDMDYEITSMTAYPQSLFADRNVETYSDIIVTVEDGKGYPAQGIAVTFEADLGYIPGKIYTNNYGIATTKFNDNGAVGMAHIIATVDGGGVNQTMQDSVEIRDLDSIVYAITSMTVNPASLYADNIIETYSDITVTVEDEEGNPAQGIAVHFAADLGYIPSTINTDDNGIATTHFNDNGELGMAHITATVSGNGDYHTRQDSVEIKDLNSIVYEITSMTVDPASIFADGILETYSDITVTVEDEEGYPAQGIAVHFTADLGYIPSIVGTDENGMATTHFNDNGEIGMAHITATVSGDGVNHTIQDSVEIRDLDYIVYEITSMTVDPATIYADNIIETYSDITVTVEDEEGYPAQGIAVHFATDLGYIPSIVGTDENGMATTHFNDNGEIGMAHILATVSGGGVNHTMQDSVEIRDLDSIVYAITSMTVDPTFIYADGSIGTYSDITVTVEDEEGYPAQGIAVHFTADLGYIPSIVGTDENGIATTHFNDNRKIGMAHIIATVGSVGDYHTMQDSVEIRDLDSIVYAITSMTVDPTYIYADGIMETHSDITVTVEDEEGYPAQGIAVRFTADLGYIPSIVGTDENGIATTYFNDNREIGMAHIIASVGGVGNYHTMQDSVEIRDADNIDYAITSMTVNPTSILADDLIETYSDITVTVEDVEGYPAQGVVVHFAADLGYIPSTIVTDDNGIATTHFNDNGVAGMAHITATVSGDGDYHTMQRSVEIKDLDSIVYEITSMTVDPTSIYADGIMETYSDITVTVEDEEGYPAQGVAVHFATDLGYIQSTINTNQYGIVSTHFDDSGEVGTAHITATIFSGGIENQTKQRSVEIKENPYLRITRITATPDIIYLDNGITYSEIEVLVKNEAGFAAIGENVYFRASIGNIIAQIITDSTGLATTNFWDAGEIGISNIDAFVGNADTTITVEILPQLPVTNLTLNLGNNNEININQVRTIIAEATNNNGPVPPGTEIVFETQLGYFLNSSSGEDDLGTTVIATTSSNGIARAFLNAGTTAGLNTVTATIDRDGIGNTLTVPAYLTVLPGKPDQMTLIPSQSSIPVNSAEDVTVTAHVWDSYGNSIGSGYYVIFGSSLGNIESPVPTTDAGIAVSTFSSGIQSGVAQISAAVDSASATTAITVYSDDVNSIQFVNQDQISIDLQGTGGVETAELSVNLFDMNGNMIDEPVEVWFKFLVRPEGIYPEGSNIGNEVYNLTDSTSTMASNGVAVVSVNSGVESGIIKIQAWCRNLEGQKISASKSNIIVQSGPPANCQFTISGDDNGEAMGAGLWKAQIAAMITDEWGNPVGEGTAVFFYLDPDPDFATIVAADAFVGNQNVDEDSLDGTAFSFIQYDGTYTNETVSVSLDVGENISFSGELVLPLQSAELTMVCTPSHLELSSTDPSAQELYTTCHITLKDGQQNRISGQRLMLISSLGQPNDDGILPTNDSMPEVIMNEFSFFDEYFNDEDNDPEPGLDYDEEISPYDGYTGYISGQLGRLQKRVLFQYWECPPPPLPGVVNSIQATIIVSIFGYNGTPINVAVTLNRYID
ncbi:MAG: invasin domain 3-containing protein [Candidatus Stygibacter frigidus]|nr:invasin domain 3-containing protein [Candidatus Stygibacter frigidus]